MTNNDIVARLRDCTCGSHGEICREAADEIERDREHARQRQRRRRENLRTMRENALAAKEGDADDAA